MDIQCPEKTFLRSLKKFKGDCYKEVCTNLFEISTVSQVFKAVFQVYLRRFPVGRDSLEVKKIIKFKFL